MGNIEVNQWFNSSRDYAEGVALYIKLSKNRLLIKKFGKSEPTLANIAKLKYEFGKFLENKDDNSAVILNEVQIIWTDVPEKSKFEKFCDFVKNIFKLKWKK